MDDGTVNRPVREVVGTQCRILLGTASERDYAALGRSHLILGLTLTWLVGIGRHWDNPRISALQQTGVGSVVYIFALAAFLYVVIWPLAPAGWNYRRILIFISLTAAPGLLYALPVERFASPAGARQTNAVFLAIVASWRVRMLWKFLRVHARLTPTIVFPAMLLPLALIVAALTALNLDRAVFEFMAGLRDPLVQTPHDVAFEALNLITGLSILASPVLLAAYIAAIVVRFRQARSAAGESDPCRGPSSGADIEAPPHAVLSDGTICTHLGETSTYCTQCWTNLYELRQRQQRSAEHQAAQEARKDARP